MISKKQIAILTSLHNQKEELTVAIANIKRVAPTNDPMYRNVIVSTHAGIGGSNISLNRLIPPSDIMILAATAISLLTARLEEVEKELESFILSKQINETNQ